MRLKVSRSGVPPAYVLLGLGLLALVVRIGFSFWVYPRLSGPLFLSFDPDNFGVLAQNWVDGIGYRFSAEAEVSTYRGPGYPLVVAATYLIFGRIFPAAVVVQCLIGALTTLVVYDIARQIYGSRTALLAGIGAALHPLLIWYSPRLRYEPLLVLLTVLAVSQALRFLDTRSLKNAVLMGLFFGLAALVSQIAILLPLVLIASMFFLTAERAALARMMALALLVMGLVISPWTVRNYRVTGGQLVPVQTGGAMEFARGIYFVEEYHRAPLQVVVVDSLANERIAAALGIGYGDLDRGERAVDEALKPLALAYVRDRPGHFLKSVIVQVPRFWYLSESPLKSWFLLMVQGVVLLPALLGAVYTLRTASRGLLVIVPPVYFNLVYASFHAKARFSTPAVPYVIILAAVGVFACIRFVESRRARI